MNGKFFGKDVKAEYSQSRRGIVEFAIDLCAMDLVPSLHFSQRIPGSFILHRPSKLPPLGYPALSGCLHISDACTFVLLLPRGEYSYILLSSSGCTSISMVRSSSMVNPNARVKSSSMSSFIHRPYS